VSSRASEELRATLKVISESWIRYLHFRAGLGAETSQNAPAAVSESPRGIWIPEGRYAVWQKHSCRSEPAANLLSDIEANFRNFSECALINKGKLPDFDSTMRRFESSGDFTLCNLRNGRQ
jgi:hypothetical protein